VTALTRRTVAAPENPATSAWRRAVEIRREWAALGLGTGPAERLQAEQCLTRIYARLGRARPAFVWVDSPAAAQPLVGGIPTHDGLHQWVYGRRPVGPRPFASDLAAAVSSLRSALDAAVERPGFDPPPPKRKKDEPWPMLPPMDALRIGIPFLEVLRRGLREALRTSLIQNLALPVRARLGEPRSLPVCWYGPQEAPWIAHYDACQRLGLAHYRHDEAEHYNDWAALVRTSGWWWPDEDICVITERPVVVHTEPVPGAWHEERRLSRVAYPDGWTVHSGASPA